MQARRREREHVVKRPQPTCRIAVGPYRDAGVTVSLALSAVKKVVWTVVRYSLHRLH